MARVAGAQVHAQHAFRIVERSSTTSSSFPTDAATLCPLPNSDEGTANGAVVGTMQSTTSSDATVFASI
jgi:hypothetical protein